MKYSCEIEINKPLEEVIALFDNPDNLKHWQPGLESIEHLSGTPGQPGAKSRLHYKMGKRDIEMIETIETRNLPKEFSGTYEAKNVYNKVKNAFVSVDETTTRLVAENEFRFRGFMKILGWFMPGAFRKQTMKYLNNFKRYAETGESVAS